MDMFMMPLLGGVLIGLSSSLLLLSLGRISGISGIFSSSILANPYRVDKWKYFFILGLLLGGLIMKIITPEFFEYDYISSTPVNIIAGLLVGFGTQLGSGCTSGHGVCGLPRKSARSLVATVTFMVFGAITVYLKGLI